MSDITDLATDTIREHPDGITAKELAARLGWKPTKASMVMGRLYFSNVLDRRGGEGPARTNNEYVYTLRQVEAPPSVRWKPSSKPIERPDLPQWAVQYAQMAGRLAEGEIV